MEHLNGLHDRDGSLAPPRLVGLCFTGAADPLCEGSYEEPHRDEPGAKEDEEDVAQHDFMGLAYCGPTS